MSASPPAQTNYHPAMQGSFRLFRFAGTDVFVHWSKAAGGLSHRPGRRFICSTKP